MKRKSRKVGPNRETESESHIRRSKFVDKLKTKSEMDVNDKQIAISNDADKEKANSNATEVSKVLTSEGKEGADNKSAKKKLPDIAPVPKRHQRLEKMKAFLAKRPAKDLKHVLPAHKYSKNKLKLDQILEIARTCENPYDLGPAFFEPSHNGIYVFKASDGSDRRLLSNMDPYLWVNNSGSWQGDVKKISWHANIGDGKGSDRWKKTAYYIDRCRKYVVRYQGNPNYGKRFYELSDFNTDSESEESDT